MAFLFTFMMYSPVVSHHIYSRKRLGYSHKLFYWKLIDLFFTNYKLKIKLQFKFSRLQILFKQKFTKFIFQISRKVFNISTLNLTKLLYLFYGNKICIGQCSQWNQSKPPWFWNGFYEFFLVLTYWKFSITLFVPLFTYPSIENTYVVTSNNKFRIVSSLFIYSSISLDTSTRTFLRKRFNNFLQGQKSLRHFPLFILMKEICHW